MYKQPHKQIYKTSVQTNVQTDVQTDVQNKCTNTCTKQMCKTNVQTDVQNRCTNKTKGCRVSQVLLEVARSILHLHSMQLLHCDVKAENVLLKGNPSSPTGFTCKVWQ